MFSFSNDFIITYGCDIALNHSLFITYTYKKSKKPFLNFGIKIVHEEFNI